METKNITLGKMIEDIKKEISYYNNKVTAPMIISCPCIVATKDTAYGFLTSGCPRGCDFCIVGHKEGRQSLLASPLKEFWHGQKNIVLCDPNILASRYADSLLEELAETGCWVDFNQGIDIRLMTDKRADIISRIKTKEIH